MMTRLLFMLALFAGSAAAQNGYTREQLQQIQQQREQAQQQREQQQHQVLRYGSSTAGRDADLCRIARRGLRLHTESQRPNQDKIRRFQADVGRYC